MQMVRQAMEDDQEDIQFGLPLLSELLSWS